MKYPPVQTRLCFPQIHFSAAFIAVHTMFSVFCASGQTGFDTHKQCSTAAAGSATYHWRTGYHLKEQREFLKILLNALTMNSR